MLGTSKSIWGFDPRSILGCQLWLDGRDTSSMTFSGSTITQWNDKSGNGYNATIAPNRVGAIYSTTYNAVNFASSTTGYITNYSAAPTNETMFVVGNNPSPSGANNIIIGGVSGARSLGLGYSNPNGIGTIGNLNTQVAWLATIGGYTSGTTALVRSQFTPSSNSVAFNGGSPATGGAPGFTAGRVTYLGVDATDGYYHYNGYMMEALFYNRILTTTEIQQVEGYLAHKWGLTTYSPVTPLSIPGCSLWLDGADPAGTGVTPSNGATVSTWVDKSGNGRNGIQYSSFARPTFLTNSLNSRGGISFNAGSSQCYQTATILPTPRAVFVVGFTSDGGFCLSGIPTVNSGHPPYYISFARDVEYGVNNTSDTPHSTNVSTSYNTNYILTGLYTGSTVSVLINGGTLSNSVAFSGTPKTPAVTLIGINSYNGSLGAALTGTINEFIAFNVDITTTQRQSIEGYLARKWGFTSMYSALPSIHPFSSIRPHLRTFQPADIPGCQLWLDAADLSVVTIATGVSQWRDKSGNANNLTQSTTGSQPSYSSSLITFESNKYLSIPASVMNNLPTWSVFFVINPISSSNWIIAKQKDGVDTYNVLSMTINTATSGAIQTGSTGFLYWRSMNAGTQAVSTAAITTSTIQVINLTYDGTNLYFYKNGILEKTTAGSFAIQNDTSPSTYTIGVSIYPGGQILNPGVTNFRLGEMLVYNTGLTTSQRETIEWYLANKWGIFSTSPVSTPLTISGSGIWLDGADTSSMTFSSGAITQWRDKSGSSNHFGLTRGTATSILDNGRNVVNFGEATVMTSTNSISFTTSSAFFIVSKMTSTNGAQDLLGFPSFGNGFALRFFSSILYSGNSDDLSLGNYYVNGNFNPSYPSTTYYNTYSLISTLVPSRGGTTVISLSDNWLLEGHAQRFFIGNIAEFIFYPGGVTNIQRQKIEGYLANKWGLTLPAPTVHPYDKYPPASLDNTPISATGGTITTSGSYKIHTFTTVGTTTFTLTSSVSISAEVLVVAGGGGGGYDDGGGGGAGGVIYSQSFTISSGSYTITLGDGGTSGTSGGVDGGNGGNTTFSSLTAIGGGGGATSDRNGKNGGSGGGVGWGASTPGTGTAGQGNAGGGGTSGPNYCAGGGGGAGGVGGTGAGTLPGNGGIGVSYTIAGTTYSVGGGGGGGLAVQNPGNIRSTASHGGGNGAGHGSVAPGSGSPNTGGGGGGGNNEQATNGGTGGSGIVIIAYKT